MTMVKFTLQFFNIIPFIHIDVLASLHHARRTVCLQFEQVIYRVDDLFITAKALSTKQIFQRSEHVVVRRCQIW